MTTQILGDTDLDTDWMSLLDWEHQIGCIYRPDGENQCENAAVWKIIASCCGEMYPMCQEHFDLTLEDLNKYDGFSCRFCGKVSFPASAIIASAEKI